MNFTNVNKLKHIFHTSFRYLYGKHFIPLELEPGQFPYPKRQIPLDGTRSFEERMQEIEAAKSGLIFDSVNIGYDIPKSSSSARKIKNPEMEMLALKKELHIDIKDFEDTVKNNNSMVNQRLNIAGCYNIYNDLFTYPHFFYPITSMQLFFETSDELYIPIYNGNLISPSTALDEPIVKFDCNDDTLWTLLMTSPDEHLEENNKEYIHWMISNISIKEGQMVSRDVNVPYLQPIPYFGTGFHRYVIVLYKQDHGRVDLSSLSLSDTCRLEDRTFSSYEFLRDHQDYLTPSGLSFFQATWDESVRQCFREKLNCLEPLFEYKWPQEKLKQQEQFPEGQVMHRYFDQYRDIKDIQEEVLKEQLKVADPFVPTKRLDYPLAIPKDPNEMGFMKEKRIDREMRVNQWRDMDLSKDF